MYLARTGSWTSLQVSLEHQLITPCCNIYHQPCTDFTVRLVPNDVHCNTERTCDLRAFHRGQCSTAKVVKRGASVRGSRPPENRKPFGSGDSRDPRFPMRGSSPRGPRCHLPHRMRYFPCAAQRDARVLRFQHVRALAEVWAAEVN